MLILTATNITPGGLAHKDGTADYDVWVGINHHCIYKGKVTGHVRDAGAGALLRIIAGQMETAKDMGDRMPVLTRFLLDGNEGIPEKATKALKRAGGKRGIQNHKQR